MEKIRVNASVSGTIGECPLQKNQAVEKDQILCIIVDENGTQHEVKSEIDATVLEIRNHPNNKVITGKVLFVLGVPCRHLTDWKGICTSCGEPVAKIPNRQTVKLSLKPGQRDLNLHVSVAMETSSNHRQKLLDNKKLIMLLDLDHTVIHTLSSDLTGNSNVQVQSVMDENPSLFSETISFKDGNDITYWVKLRPNAVDFIAEMSKYYEINVYTAAVRTYADEIVKHLDPAGKYIGNRVLTRTECGNDQRKFISRLFPYSAELVVIVDDSVQAWEADTGKYHLYKIRAFTFFSHEYFRPQPIAPVAEKSTPEVSTTDKNSSTEKPSSPDDKTESESSPDKKVTENDTTKKETTKNEQGKNKIPWIYPKTLRDDELNYCSGVLRRIHEAFFEEDPYLSVNQVLTAVRHVVLRGVHILFSSVVSKDVSISQSPFWFLANAFGAVCYEKYDPKVTHVVCACKGTDKYNWGIKENKKVVQISWFVHCIRHWNKPSEPDYSFSKLGNCSVEHLTLISKELAAACLCYPYTMGQCIDDIFDFQDSNSDSDSDSDSDTSDSSSSSDSSNISEPPAKLQKIN